MSVNEFTDAERFVEAYNRIDHVLRRGVPDTAPYTPFSELVRKSVLFAPPQRDFLLDCADLRNAILHTRGSSTGHPIADPRAAIVEKIERQADLLENPPRVREALKLQPPRVLDDADDLGVFLDEIVRYNYSQVVVRTDGGGLELVTTNAIARWFAARYQADEGIAADSAPLADVRAHAEVDEYLLICPRDLTVVEAWRAFAGTRTDRRVPSAVVLTQNGLSRETPIGICVRADLPALLAALE